MLQVTINGEVRPVPPGTSINQLVKMLGLAPDRVAIEYNRQIVRRPRWTEVQVGDGDKLEIVQFVGGG